MPCTSAPPSRDERRRARLIILLTEIGDPQPTERSTPGMTRALCTWCTTHDVSQQSLKLQIWWRDHQRWDAERKAAEKAKQRQQRIKRSALAKLTPEERRALGLKED